MRRVRPRRMRVLILPGGVRSARDLAVGEAAGEGQLDRAPLLDRQARQRAPADGAFRARPDSLSVLALLGQLRRAALELAHQRGRVGALGQHEGQPQRLRPVGGPLEVVAAFLRQPRHRHGR